MKIEILGSGGAAAAPKPGCGCEICTEARRRGVPYHRTGPSYFLRDANVLFDTPEESMVQINRAEIERIAAAFYSHWHPDHTRGNRIFERMNGDFRHWPPQPACTDVYLPPQVAADFETRQGLQQAFAWMSDKGWVRVHRLAPGAQVWFGDISITPFPVAEAYVYAFLIEQGDKRILLAPDELVGWTPPDFVRGVDLAILPMGVTEFNPFTGARHIPADHPVLTFEATFRQTLDMVRAIDARQVVLGHIEEPDQVGHDALTRLSEQLQADGLPITFAWDTRVLEV